MENIIKDKIAYERKKPLKGYMIKAWYLKEPKEDALVVISKAGNIVREFLFPSYKIWNIPAHENDIIDGLERDSDEGLYIAGSTGLGGNVYAQRHKR